MSESSQQNSREFKDISIDLFGGYKKWSDFIKQFNLFFPMPNGYQDKEDLKFDKEAIVNGKISCAGSAVLMYYWALKNKPEYYAVFVTKRKPKHTHVYLGFVAKNPPEESYVMSLRNESVKLLSGNKSKDDARWYHLTDAEGMQRLDNSKLPVSALIDAMHNTYNTVPEASNHLPKYQVFTDPLAFQQFFKFDLKYRSDHHEL